MTATLDPPRIRLPYPHAGQRRVAREMRRHNRLAAGRRWRKTTFGVARAVERMLEGQRGIWGAPTYDQVRIAWEELKTACGGVASFLKSEMTIEFPWSRGRLVLRSFDDPDNARGHTADFAILDEAADIPEDAYYGVVRPMLLDTGGWSLIMGTPKGLNWFWREYEYARDREDHVAWQIPTLGVQVTSDGLVRDPHPYENPEVAFKEIQELYATTPELLFQQEILAVFLEGGVVLRNVDACATGSLKEPYAGTFALGVDWGKVVDWTVLTLMDCATREVVAWDRFNQVDWHVQMQRLQALYVRWTSGEAKGATVNILAERNNVGGPIIEALLRMGLPVTAFETTNLSKASIVEALALDLEQRALSYPPIPQLLAELRALVATTLPSGLIRYAAPEGMHDDCVISLALANKGARMPPIASRQQDTSFTLGPQEHERESLLSEYKRQRRAARGW